MIVSDKVLEPQADAWEWKAIDGLVRSSLIRQGGASTQGKPELAEMGVPEALMTARNRAAKCAYRQDKGRRYHKGQSLHRQSTIRLFKL